MVVRVLFNQGKMTMAAHVSLKDEILDELLGESKSAGRCFLTLHRFHFSKTRRFCSLPACLREA